MTDTRTAVVPFTIARGPVYDHLIDLSDEIGVFEHALYSAARPEHGYCVDDVARALIVAVREPDQTEQLTQLTETCLRFLEAAVTSDGRAHNRRSIRGEWTDQPGVGDWWGRALWAAGATAAAGSTPMLRHRAARLFARAAQQRSPHLHATAFAALGACALLRVRPADTAALRIAHHLIGMVPPTSQYGWAWPQARMTYSSASIAEAVMSSGAAVGDTVATAHGLALIRFVLALNTRNGHLSVTGTGGRGPEDIGGMFDQQPIEVAAIADAAVAAHRLTRAPEWLDTVRLAWSWFEGHNDAQTLMVDRRSGAGFDGLEVDGRNENQGAESTLAALSTWQLARWLVPAGFTA